MNMTAIENAILAKMPNPELTRIVGEANYTNLNRIRKEVNQTYTGLTAHMGVEQMAI